MTKFNFKNDLKRGQIGENLIKKLFEQKGIKVDTNTSKDYKTLKEYDLLLNNMVKVEVKTDYLLGKTPNFCIEIECNNKPSGITSTKSILFIYIAPELKKIYVFKTKDLLKLVNDKKYKRLVNGGEGNRAKLALFPFNTVVNEAKKIIRY